MPVDPEHFADNPRERWWNNPFETLTWATGAETFNKGDVDTINTLRFEFPTWIRETTKNISKVLIDNVVLREKLNLTTGVKTGFPDPVFPASYVNIIQNGGFEDDTLNLDGSKYVWEKGSNDNSPWAVNSLLGSGYVRIQNGNKDDDNVKDNTWAHSGNHSIRFSTAGSIDGDKANRNLNYTVELEAGKTYRFSFWHRSPIYKDPGRLKVQVGNTDIWEHKLGFDDDNRNNFWSNADLVFTTTDENKNVTLYTADHGDWFNLYLDDLVLYEVTGDLDPQIAGKTNLIANGDFEKDTIDNEGNAYTWALASGDAKNAGDNYPVAYSDLWKGYVRLQDVRKGDDTGLEWAHSGTKSLRISYLADEGNAKKFENITEPNVTPEAWKVNINFEKELEIGKTYTFVFWLKVANYPDRGTLKLANGDAVIWQQELSAKYINWTRNSITFTTNAADHTLRMFTEFGGWFNFYLDDLFLFEDDASNADNSYIFFGKSQNTASADVEVEYVNLITDGAYDPAGNVVIPEFNVIYHENGGDDLRDTSFIAESGVIVLPAASRTGYTFAGWYDNVGLNGDAKTEVAKSVGHKAFWAKWTVIEYTITYNKDAKFTTISDGKYTIENAVTLPTVLGYDIKWYDNATFTGATVTEIPVGSIGDKEFWLTSEPIPYTITYNESEVAAGTYTTEAAVTLPALPTKTGFTFLGWYNNSRFIGDPVTEIPAGSTGNKEYWAKWETSTENPNAVSSLSASALHIYPNPVVNGVLNIGNLSGSSKVEIYSVSGALVGVYSVTGTHAAVNISALPSGTYVVKINNQTATIVKE
jgi:uncharacterized repeat protein (TIGR02543 family)